MESTPPSKFYSNNSSPLIMHHCSSSSGGGLSSVGNCGDGGLGYIEHTVSKFDTLAGVAIKYGVEVADIKRINGLTSDLQMFALKSLQIPLPGRHPPSPILSNGYDTRRPTSSERTSPNHRNSDLFDSIKSLKLSSSPSSSSSQRNISPAMNSLRGYYGLPPNNQNGIGEGFEMAVYNKDGSKPKQFQIPSIALHRKCKSLADELCEEEASADKSNEKLVRRRKSEVDLKNHTPEMLLKHDNNNSGAFSAAAGKGLALRSKAANRAPTDAEGASHNAFPFGFGDSLETFGGVRKSWSTPSFQESENNNNNTSSSSSIWPTSMLSLTAELQALSTSAIARPIFDGLPKPITGRKNKTALD